MRVREFDDMVKDSRFRYECGNIVSPYGVYFLQHYMKCFCGMEFDLTEDIIDGDGRVFIASDSNGENFAIDTSMVVLCDGEAKPEFDYSEINAFIECLAVGEGV